MSVLASSLGKISKASEPNFMKIGTALQSIYSDAKELTRLAIKTIELIGGESQKGFLTKVGTLVNESLEKARNRRDKATEDQRLVDGYVQEVSSHLSHTFGLSSDLIKTAKYLRAVGLQMRIECSRTDDAMEMFSVVAHEIGALSNKFVECAEKIRDDSTSTQQSQIAAQEDTSKLLHELFRLAEDSEQTIQSSMTKIERLMKLSIENLDHAGEQADRISKHVEDVVVAIQFHDNMRQRIEHITESIADAERNYYRDSSSAEHVCPSKGYRAVSAVLDLQKAQLQNIISEINSVHGKAKDAFQKIADEILSLTQVLSSLEIEISALSFQGKHKGDDPFEALKSSLQHMHRLIDQTSSIVEHMHETIAQASTTVTGLSSHTERVRQLSFETHLTAINAIVKAKQLGEAGMALDKLVHEATGVSDWATKFATDIEKIQNSILDSAAGLKPGDQVGEDDHGAEFSLQEVLDDISDGGILFKKHSSDVLKRAHILEKAISAVRTELDFLPALAGELAEHQQQLEEISCTLNLSEGEQADLTKEEIDEINKRYTMHGERKVHTQFIEQMNNSTHVDKSDIHAQNKVEKASGKKPDNDEFGDNVELF